MFLLFRGFKSMCYGTKQETETPQLSLSRDYLQIVGRAISFVAQLLQGTSNDAYKADKEKYRTIHYRLRIRGAAGFVSHGKPIRPV